MKATAEDGRPHDGATSVAFLFDVDNTLLDNDRIIEDMRLFLRRQVGDSDAAAYWEVFQQLRNEIGYADYLGALQRYRSIHPTDFRLLAVSHFLITYPFAKRLFPDALQVVGDCARHGVCALLSDGDVVFQPWKIERAGLRHAVEGRVFVYVHKEEQLSDVHERLGCDHYVMVDDKLRLLAAAKAKWGIRVTTVFVRQGHYAHDPTSIAGLPPADVTVEQIADLSGWLASIMLDAGRGAKEDRRLREPVTRG